MRDASAAGAPRRPLLIALAALGSGALAASLGAAWAVVPVGLAAAGIAGFTARRGGAAGRGALACGLLALFLAGAWRTPPPPRASDAPVERGIWRARGATGRGELVDGARRTRLEIEAGAARDGELLSVLPGRPAARLARGPVASSGRPPAREVAADELLRVAPAGGGTGLGSWVGALREKILGRIDRLRDARTRGLAAALLVGDRSELPRGLTDLFTRTGMRHALAISGMHVGLVAAILIWPLGTALAALWRSIARGRAGILRTPAPWRALLLAVFAPVAGGGAPVVRAALALALFQLAPRVGAGAPRRVDPLSLWAFAALFELAASPVSIQSSSLALSYLATLGLIVGTGPVLRWLNALWPASTRRVTRHGRALPEAWLAVRSRVGRAARMALALSLAASFATLPIVWSQWGEWSPVGCLVTPLFVLPLSGFLAAGWLYALLPFDPPGLELVLGGLSEWMVGLLELADRLPCTPQELPTRPTLLLFTAGGLGLAAAAIGRGGTLRRLTALAAGVCVLPWALAPARLELWVLDVGYGTACVFRAPGTPCWIFDAGSRDRPGVARAGVAPLLRNLEVARCGVVLSHAHSDHDGALDWLMMRFPPVAWLGALPARLDERLPPGVPRIDLDRGSLDFVEDTEGRSQLAMRLWRGINQEGNEGSRSLELLWEGRRLFLCGDAEGAGLAASLAAGGFAGPCDLLLLPHHGSESPFLGRLLASARPKEVWISAGGPPPVGPELDRRGVLWRCTAREGALEYPDHGTLSEAPGLPLRQQLDEPLPPGPAAPAGLFSFPRKESLMSKGSRPEALVWLGALATLALSPLVITAAARQADAPSAGTSEQELDPRTEERNRVLYLADGSFLRGKTRWTAGDSGKAGRWEIRSGRAWRAVSGESVESWRSVRELTKEARHLRDALGRGDHQRRAELAAWLAKKGLLEEAEKELDRVLRADPDNDRALSVINTAPFDLSAFGDPRLDPEGTVKAALKAGQSRSPFRRELAVRALRGIQDHVALRDRLRRSLGAFQLRQRYFATLALRRLMPGEELLNLVMRAAYDPSTEVREGASHALRDTHIEGVIVPLVNALESEDGMLRIRVAESLGNTGFEAAVPALINAMAAAATQGSSSYRAPGGNIYIGSEVAYVGDYDVEIAQAASIADPIVMTVHSGIVLEARAWGLQDYSSITEVQTIRQSLKSLTGHDAGRSHKKWIAWFEANRERFEPAGDKEK